MTDRVEIQEQTRVEVRHEPAGVDVRTVLSSVERRQTPTRVEVQSGGAQGPPGETVIISARAAVNLSGHRVVSPRPDGAVVYADPTDVSFLSRAMWLTRSAAVAGDMTQLLAVGELAEATWAWVPEAAIYLGANGQLSQVPPGPGAVLWLQLATAVTPTVIYFDPQTPVLLAP